LLLSLSLTISVSLSLSPFLYSNDEQLQGEAAGRERKQDEIKGILTA